MLDDQHGDTLVQPLDRLQDGAGVGGGHAGGGLIQQEDARARGQGDRDLDDALSAVGQGAGRLQRDRRQAERVEQRESLVQERVLAPQRAPEMPARAGPLGERERHVVDHRECAEQLVDLEGAGEPEPHPRVLRQTGDVGAAQADPAGARRQRSGDQVDQRGLAGAVRPDQRVARAVRQPEVDAIGHPQRAEALAQAKRLQRRRLARAISWCSPDAVPLTLGQPLARNLPEFAGPCDPGQSVRRAAAGPATGIPTVAWTSRRKELSDKG